MEGRLFGLSSIDLRKIAYQLAVKNNKKNNFSQKKEMAGYDWYRCFMARHPELSLRKPEATSIARAMGFNRVVVGQFYELLGGLLETYKFSADRIYNCDETGISSVPKCKSKIIASKGRKQVGAVTSAERGETITVEICMSAAGSFMPPLFVFPRQRHNLEFMRNAPPGSFAEFHKTGWMQKEIFERWLEKFIIFTNASKDRPVLLILDGHSTHTKSIELIQMARDNGVILLCFPPHCTHKIQPLDVGFMKPLSTYYDKEATNWLRNNGGNVITVKQVAEIFGLAYIKATSMSTAINAFKKTGIWPLNPDVFTDVDFMAAETTNIDEEIFNNIENDSLSINQNDAMDNLQIENLEIMQIENIEIELLEDIQIEILDDIQLESYVNPETISTPKTNKPVPSTSFEKVSPKDIMPVPQQSIESKQRKRKNIRRGKTVILTSSPYKNDLQNQKDKAKQKCVKKNLFPKKNKTATKTKKRKTEKKKLSDENDDECCLYCGEPYSTSNEGWVQCRVCDKWAHCSCAGEDDSDKVLYHICDICKQDT